MPPVIHSRWASRNTLPRRGCWLLTLFVVAVIGLAVIGAQPAGATSHQIGTCQVITTEGEYEVTQHLNDDDNVCLVIQASNVTVDGMGHDIFPQSASPNPGAVGVYLDGSSQALTNVTVQNATVTGWANADSHGIEVNNVTDSTLANLTVTHNDIGINTTETDGLTINAVNASLSGTFGLHVGSRAHNTILAHVTALQNGQDGLTVKSDRNEIRDANVSRNMNRGVVLSSSANNTLTNVTANQNVGSGIAITGAANVLEGTITNRNGASGVDVASNANRVANATTSNNTDHGVLVRGLTDHTVIHNVAGTENGLSGVSLSSAGGMENTSISNSTLTGNSDGILVYGAPNTTVANSTLAANDGFAIQVTNGASNGTFDNINIGRSSKPQTTISFTGRDIAVTATSQPPDHPFAPPLGRNVTVNSLATDAYIDLALQYTDGDLSTVDESKIGLWRTSGFRWSEIDSTRTPADNEVSANLTDLPDTGFVQIGAFETITGTLEGQVTANGSPLQGAPVSVFNFDVGVFETTNATGNYQLDLPPGNYTVQVSASNYVDAFREEVRVSENQTTVEDFSLEEGATIKGQVTDPQGNNASNAWVMADGPEQRFAGTDRQTGEYQLEVPAGNYTLTAFGQNDQISNQTFELSLSSNQTVTRDFSLINVSVTNASVSYLGGSGNPDMTKISADASFAFGMIQVRLLNDSSQTFPGMPNDLAGLGVAADDRFKINFTVDGYDPATLLWGAKNITWSTTDNGDGSVNVSVKTETVHMEGITNGSLPVGPLQGQTPEEVSWPEDDRDSADIGWDRTVYFGLFDMANVPADRLGNFEGMTIGTNAQAFSRPRIVEANISNSTRTREELRIYVAGPNTTVAGNNHSGFYEAFVPNSVLTDWNVDEPETDLEALYKGEQQDFSVDNSSPDGALLELNITYSDGTVAMAPADHVNFSVDVSSTNSPIQENETLEVNTTVENTGTTTGTQTVTLDDLDGNQVDSQSVTLDAGESTDITLEWSTGVGDAGQGTVTVSSENQTDTASVSINGEDPANFSVAIDGSNAPVVAGDVLTVTATIENTGDNADTQAITLSDVDGVEVDSTTISLSGGDSTEVTLEWQTDEGDAGSGDLTVASDNDSETSAATVQEPASLSVTITGTNAPVTAGDQLTVDVDVSNPGDVSRSGTISVAAGDGSTGASQDVSLAAGESTSLTLAWETTADDAGNHTLSVTSPDDSASTQVQVLAPPAFDVRITDVPTSVVAGEPMAVQVQVDNPGDVDDQQAISLTTPNGDEAASVDVSVDAGQSSTATLTWQTSEGNAGSGTIEVASADASDTVDVEISAPAAFDVRVTDPPSPTLAGDALTVDVTIENIGAAAGTEVVELVGPDGSTLDERTVDLDAGDTTTATLTWDTDGETTGEHRLTISAGGATDTADVTVERPGQIDVTIAGTNGPITAGEDLEISIRAENTGDRAVEQRLMITTPGGQSVTGPTVSLDPGESLTRDLTIETSDSNAGEHAVTVRSEDAEATEAVTLAAAGAPANFKLRDVDSNAPIEGGETLVVTFTVENTGDGVGSHEIRLEQDDEVLDTVTVELDAGESDTRELSWDPPANTEGVTLSVIGPNDSATLSVDPFAEPPGGAGSDALPGFGPIAALLAMLIVGSRIIRRGS